MTSFSEQPDPQLTVKSGHAAIFEFPAISSEPEPSVSWQSDDLALLYGTKYATTRENKLIILSVDDSDQKQYRCNKIRIIFILLSLYEYISQKRFWIF